VKNDDDDGNLVQSAHTDGKKREGQNTLGREDATEQMSSKLHRSKDKKSNYSHTTTTPLPQNEQGQQESKEDGYVSKKDGQREQRDQQKEDDEKNNQKDGHKGDRKKDDQKKEDHKPEQQEDEQTGGHKQKLTVKQNDKPGQDSAKSKKQDMPNKAHVLLVDDNKINLNLLTMFMRKCGFTYEEAENGQEAVETFTKSTIGDAQPPGPVKKRFDYILMDISMPVMNGVEATKRIRKLEAKYKIPRTTVFALTGLASADARLDAMSAGVDLFLPKPVKFAELKTMIENN
jgi:CheY-like chemotaxis protein